MVDITGRFTSTKGRRVGVAHKLRYLFCTSFYDVLASEKWALDTQNCRHYSFVTMMMLLTTAASTFWTRYNSDDSFLPFYLPFSLWAGTYLYSKRSKSFEFHKCTLLHNIHNVTAIAIGTASIVCNNKSFNERISILFSLSYFAVDLIDCVVRKDLAYSVHGALCVLLGLANYLTPLLRQLRMNSKAAFCELSSPFLHVAKKSKAPVHFAIFALAFTVCRVVWIPIMMRQLSVAGMEWTNPILIGLTGFYGLNLYWYAKIVKMLYDGLTGKSTKPAKED
jgi:hypothetical protein